jgi:hypothetical protein
VIGNEIEVNCQGREWIVVNQLHCIFPQYNKFPVLSSSYPQGGNSPSFEIPRNHMSSLTEVVGSQAHTIVVYKMKYIILTRLELIVEGHCATTSYIP